MDKQISYMTLVGVWPCTRYCKVGKFHWEKKHLSLALDLLVNNLSPSVYVATLYCLGENNFYIAIA